MGFNTCTDSCNYHLKQDTELFHHPQKMPLCSPFVVKLIPLPHPNQATTVPCHLPKVLPFPECPIKNIIQYLVC